MFVCVEEEKFALRAYIKGITHVGRLLQRFAQDIARIALKRLSILFVYVADQARNLSVLRMPRQQAERVEIWPQIHVGLLDAHKAFNGGTVEHALVIQRFPRLATRNGNILQRAENIGELQANEFHVVFLENAKDVFLGVFGHET